MQLAMLYDALKIVAISFFFLFILFVPMEKVFPAKKGQRIIRPHWVLDFVFS